MGRTTHRENAGVVHRDPKLIETYSLAEGVPQDDNTVIATPGAQGSATASLIRLTITHNERRLDIGVPTHTPLVEHLPSFVRHLGALDPTLVYGGYGLVLADGTTLNPQLSLGEQGVREGDLLTLVSGALQPEAHIYDDVVEAVGDAVDKQQSPWTGRDSSRTALATSTAFLAVGAILLATSAQPLFGALVAAAGAILIIAVAAILSRMHQQTAGLVLGLTAALYGAVSGLLLVPAADLWGYPIAGAGVGAIVVASIAAAVLPKYRDYVAIPGVAGVVLAVAGAITALTGFAPSAVFGLTLAISATLSNGLPWLALSSARITVISPHSDQELFITPPPIDGVDTAARYSSGHRLLVILRISLTVVALVTVAPVVGSGVPGALLATLAFVGLMTTARQTFARLEVMTIMAAGLTGLVVTGIAVAVQHPTWHPVLVVVLVASAALLVGLTLLSSRSSLRVGRIADTVDLFALALLLPLGVAVAGLA